MHLNNAENRSYFYETFAYYVDDSTKDPIQSELNKKIPALMWYKSRGSLSTSESEPISMRRQ